MAHSIVIFAFLREKLPKHRLKGYGGDPVWIHVD